MNINRAKGGFLKLHYKIQDSDLWYDNNGLIVFLRMIGFAHHEDDFTSVRFSGKQRYLKRGEFSATMPELAKLTNVKMGTLRDVISRLEGSRRINRQTDNHTTVFSICNFSKYQDAPTSHPANHTSNNPANNPADPPLSIKNIKNIKNNIYVELDDQFRRFHILACELFGKDPDRYKLSAARKKQLKVRLKDTGAERMEKALRAIAASPFHRGENERAWEADPYWVFSSYEKTEKWAELAAKDAKNIDLSKIEIEV